MKEIPNFTGVTASPRLTCSCVALNCSTSRRRAEHVAGLDRLLPDGLQPLRMADGLSVRGALARAIEVTMAQFHRVDTEQRGAAAEDVLEDDHPLGAAEAAEGRIRRLVGLGDPPVDPGVGNPIGVVDVAQRPGQHRLGQVQAPPAVSGEGRLQREQVPVGGKADPPVSVKAVTLAGHRQILGAVEPQAYGTAGEHGAQSRDRGEPVGLHLLAAECAAHPQALHGDLRVPPAQDVGDDLLGLGGMLRAGLDEDLTGLVDVGQRGVGLQVEMLLAGELELAAEHPVGAGQRAVDVATRDLRLATLEAVRGDRLADRHIGRQRLGCHLDGLRAEPGGLERLSEHPADGVAEEHDLRREQRLVVLDAGVVDARHVLGGEHPDHAGNGEGRRNVERGDPRVGVGRLHRVGVQDVLGAVDQVVGVEGRSGDMQHRALVWDREPDRRAFGSRGQVTH